MGIRIIRIVRLILIYNYLLFFFFLPVDEEVPDLELFFFLELTWEEPDFFLLLLVEAFEDLLFEGRVILSPG